MTTERRRVIDGKGFYITTVIVAIQTDGSESILVLYGRPTYLLQPGERLVNMPSPPSDLVRPLIDGEGWKEGATAQQIEQARLEREQEQAGSTPGAAPPSETELMLAEIMIAMGQLQQETTQAVAELTMAMAMMGGESNV